MSLTEEGNELTKITSPPDRNHALFPSFFQVTVLLARCALWREFVEGTGQGRSFPNFGLVYKWIMILILQKTIYPIE